MKTLWSKELRCTTKGSNKWYKLEVISRDGALKMEYLVRASWAGVGKKASMQDKGTYTTQSQAVREAEILATAKSKKGYKVYKTKKAEKKKSKTEGMSLREMSRSRFSRFVR